MKESDAHYPFRLSVMAKIVDYHEDNDDMEPF